MDYATNIAIVEDGTVSNIIWGMVYDMDKFPGAVQIDGLGVNIGDSYDGENFYHDGQIIRPQSSIMDDMLRLQAFIDTPDWGVLESGASISAGAVVRYGTKRFAAVTAHTKAQTRNPDNPTYWEVLTDE